MNILVVGDVIIDRYTHGTRRGISAETPTIVANLTKEETFVGGAGLVVRNLLRLGHVATLVTPGRGVSLTNMFRLSADPISPSEATRLNVDQWEFEGWNVTEKRRYFVEQYKLLQYDIVNEGKWKTTDHMNFLNRVKRKILGNDAVVLCDNRHGTFTKEMARGIIKECHKLDVPVYVDSQVSQSTSNHEWYSGADFIFLNEAESDAVAVKIPKGARTSQLQAIAKYLQSAIVYKRGERGCVLQLYTRAIPSVGFSVKAVDTCGAGDAFLAAFVSGPADLEQRLEAANRWAALSTTYKGTIVPRLEDLEKVQR